MYRDIYRDIHRYIYIEIYIEIYSFSYISLAIYIYICKYTHIHLSSYFSKKENEIKIRNNQKLVLHRLRFQAFIVVFLSFRPLQRMGKVLEISIAGWKCLCVSGKVALWSKHFDIIISFPMSYLKL